MWRLILLCTLAVGTLQVACSHAPAAIALPICPTPSYRDWNGDSTLAICVPPGFARIDHDSWARPRVQSAAKDLFSVELLDWPDDSAMMREWPIHLDPSLGCLADCFSYDSMAIHTDTAAGVTVHTETALLSGGFAGVRREPHLVMSWELAGGRRGIALARTAIPATLDTLRAAVRSLWVKS
jgi:hypothetical protein